MLFFRLQVVGVLRRFCCCAPVSTAVKCLYSGLPTSSFSTPYSAHTTSRALSTTWILRKDVPQPKDMEARPELDLDVWKSMMRSQALQEEKPRDKDDGDDVDEESTAVEQDQEKLSPLEASRRLIEMWRLAGKLVPVTITDNQLETLSELTSRSAKKKYLKYLTIKEVHKRAKNKKKENKMAERMAERTDGDREGVDEDNGGDPKLRNSYLMQFWSRSNDKVLGWRAVQAMQYGQPLVFDMSYDQHMSRKEIENTISQLLETEGCNRRAVDPFHLHYCNLQPSGTYHRELVTRYGQETWERLLITTTSQRHIDVFPHEDLVYLTADSPKVLHTFDHSKVYIVGALVDRSSQSGLSLANAKRLKLATARLPLDEYLHWGCGAKNLTLDQMIRILLTIKETGSWEKALEFVPKRKHIGFYQQITENSVPSTAPVRTATSAYRGSQPDSVPLILSKQRLRSQRAEKPALKSEQISGQARLRTGLKSKIEERSKTSK